MKDEPDYYERHRSWMNPSQAWIDKQAAAFVEEMERQKKLFGGMADRMNPEQLPRQLTREEIEKLSASEYAIYKAAMRDVKRRRAIQKREDPKDKPGKGSGWDPYVHGTP